MKRKHLVNSFVRWLWIHIFGHASNFFGADVAQDDFVSQCGVTLVFQVEE